MELHDDHHTKNLTLTLALERFMMRRQPRESDYDDWEIPVNVDPFIYDYSPHNSEMKYLK